MKWFNQDLTQPCYQPAGIKSPVSRVASKAPVPIIVIGAVWFWAGSKVLPPVFAASSSKWCAAAPPPPPAPVFTPSSSQGCAAVQRSCVQTLLSIFCHRLSASHTNKTLPKRMIHMIHRDITWLFTLKVKASQSLFLGKPKVLWAWRHSNGALLKLNTKVRVKSRLSNGKSG